jgi:Radical SAM superfamily/4Fe-4S single cluster domain
MRFQELFRPAGIRPLKFALGEVPHGTVETNLTCNLHCRACYNLSRDVVKTVKELKDEIDLLLQKRKLQVITVLGGEPTLHPGLREIVAYIKSKGVICQLLTNGLVFLEDPTNGLLDGLKAEGLDKLLLHLDEGQKHVHADLEKARRTLFAKCQERKIKFSLSLTIYSDTGGQIPALIKKYAGYRCFDGILAVLSRDLLSPKAEDPQLLNEYQGLLAGLGIEPLTYIPSFGDDQFLAWVFYGFFINARTAEAVSVSQLFDRSFRKLYKYLKGRNFFVMRFHPSLIGLLFLASGVADIASSPKKIARYWQVFRKSSVLRNLRLHYVAIQTPPEISQPRDRIKICYGCPDATIRNGQLTPVCMADLVNPLNGNLPKDAFRDDLGRLVYGYLGER